jgi:hypothetical protein
MDGTTMTKFFDLNKVAFAQLILSINVKTSSGKFSMVSSSLWSSYEDIGLLGISHGLIC